MDLADDQRAVPNVVLEKLTLDVPTFALSEPEWQPPCAGKTVTNEKGEPVVDLVNSHVGATAVVSASGSYLVDGIEMPIPMLEVRATIDVPGLGQRPIEIYDSQSDAFFSALFVPSLPFGSKVSVHLDLKLPPWVVDELVTLYRTKISQATYLCEQQCLDPLMWGFFQASSQNECWINCVASAMGLQGINLGGLLTVTVTPLAPDGAGMYVPIAEYEPPGLALGNDFQVQVNFLPPAPTATDGRSWHEEGTLEKGFSSGGFGAGVEFWGALTFDKNGALAQGSADIPVTIFGSSFDILDFDATAYGSPEHWTEAYYRHDLEFAGFTIHSHSISAAGLEGQTPEWIKPYLTYDVPVFQVGQRKGINKLIFIGIVPVFASAGVDGYVGFLSQAQINVNEEHFEDWPQLTLSTGPAAGFGAYAGATVEAIIFSVGVQGKVNLLSDTFFYTAGAALEYTPAVADPPSPALLTAGLWEDVTNRLEGPNGRLTLFADYPTGIRWCKKWGFFYYPCGIKRKRASQDLIRFDFGFEKEDVLVCEAIDSLTIPLE